jgi:hypothetical protein
MKSISDNVKKRGRPKTGIGEPVGLRLYPEMDLALNRWIRDQNEPQPGKPEAIRRILEDYLRRRGYLKNAARIVAE